MADEIDSTMTTMKKYISPLLLLLFVSLTVLIIAYRKPEVRYTLVDRKNVNDGEWLNTRQAIQNLLTTVRNHPQDQKSKLQLAYAYIQEGRTSGNHAYYDPAALA